ncbi:hypothetical protein F511_04396 [Dorcoceras hygrometricum]|uniref:Transmembrane protein n=1 Tax=Dorcoceras hygrometricum TaxID=472368 RepID=A0A2Z7BKH8_9LAMI|nr:hypothetical protein F511_04396 [Dorcoceras hygrometricum]
MEFKARLLGTLLLIFLVVAPSFSGGKLLVRSMESEFYDIDYRGPETHTYLPPPTQVECQPDVDHKARCHRTRVQKSGPKT